MTKDEIISKVKTLNWPQNMFVVYGSAPLALLGIREAKDIDFYVAPLIYSRLESEGWKKIYKSKNDHPLTKDVFEVHDNWGFSSFNPTLDDLLKRANIVDGIPFASLQDVRKWKVLCKRPKDIEDVKLIDSYLKNGN